MAILHFFCDESGKYQKNPIVSISGLGVSQERGDAFHAEWRTLLRPYGLNELSMRHAMKVDQTVGTKLLSGQTMEQRQQALCPFADCINKYMEIGLVQGWSVIGYAKIPMEAKKLLSGANDPYQLAFIRGLMAIAHYVAAVRGCRSEQSLRQAKPPPKLFALHGPPHLSVLPARRLASSAVPNCFPLRS